ncbi:hypothetical protein POTOM_060273 [Populus tomentosa]|uniref:Auxin efflux carrier family protein n=1 Tax=Populus tomentosa TaxID=118781 RepID=A0A8X7XUW7_POPTO|nr:hypothetical protein POTOM_060273 [Populus tomentosa]
MDDPSLLFFLLSQILLSWGIPLFESLYGDFSGNLMVQIVVLQKLDSDVVSLNGREPLQADAEIGDDARPASPKHGYTNSFQGGIGDVYSLQSSKGATPRTSNYDEEMFEVREEKRTTKYECSSASPVSEGNLRHAVNRAASTDFGVTDPSKAAFQHESAASKGGTSRCPSIVSGSIAILSDAGLGMAMFSLGLFMALQPKIIACGKSVATFAMAVRFLTGPAVIAATSLAIGIRGVLLHVAIVQAALPQGIVPFVFAKEYNVHPDILSTAVIFGMCDCLAHYSTLLCASWRLTSWKTRQGKEYTTVNPSQAKVDGCYKSC